MYPLKIIKNDKQYFAYCNELERLLVLETPTEEIEDIFTIQ